MRTMFLIGSLILLPAISVAQDDLPSGPPLTQSRAESYVACLADLIELEEKYADDESYFEEDEEEFEDWASMIASMEEHPAYGEFMSALEKHGFESAEDWVQTSSRFLSAYSAAKMGGQQIDMEAEMQKAIDAINENQMLTEEQKQESIEMMRSQMGAMELYQQDVSEAEIEAVKSVMAEFEALTMEEGWEEEY